MIRKLCMDIEFYIHPTILEGYEKNLRYTVAYGGRGSGKSFQFGALCIIYALQNPGSRILCVRGTQSKISESSLQILKDVIDMMCIADFFEITEHTLECNNGSKFLFYGAKNYNSFKSLQGIDLVFVDEATELSGKAWEALIPTIRSDDSKFLVSFNPELESDWCYENFILNQHPRAYVTKLNFPDNPYFPKVLRDEMEYDKSRSIKKYLHIWEGELVQETEGALWNTEMISHIPDEEMANLLLTEFEYMERIVVSVDPSITSKSTSDACGIVVAGKYANKDEYLIIDDITKIASPNEWSGLAIAAYDKYKADRIVAEVNQGGDMVKTIIKNKRPDVAYKGVHASRGKTMRAEPIADLYEEGKVKHFKRLPTLEYEMVTYTGDKKDKSPNALDAMVWALTELNSNSVKTPKGMTKATTRFNF